MKLVITEKEQGKIIAKQTVIKLVVNPFSSDAGKMPLSLYEAKGDLIAGKGVANPVRVAVGTDGQVLVADSNAEGGIGWKVMALGTATLRNSESVAVTAGTVVTTTGMTAGNFRVATAADTMNLFVAAENILSGQLGVIYNASGKDCTVKVTDGAVSAGDKLTVSATDGVAEVTTGADYFAQAITNKAAGAAGTVICVLVNTVQTIIPIEGGGTNASNAEGARDNLGVTALFNATTGHDHDGTDSKKIAASNVDGLADYFNASTGHDHDGTDSKKIAYSNITGTPAFETSASNIKAVGTASVGSLTTLARADHVHPSESYTVVWSGTSSSGSALTPSVDYVMTNQKKYKCICLFGSGASFHAAEFIFNSGDTTLESVAALTKMSDSSVSGIKLVITLDTSTRKIASITPTYSANLTSIRSISFIRFYES